MTPTDLMFALCVVVIIAITADAQRLTMTSNIQLSIVRGGCSILQGIFLRRFAMHLNAWTVCALFFWITFATLFPIISWCLLVLIGAFLTTEAIDATVRDSNCAFAQPTLDTFEEALFAVKLMINHFDVDFDVSKNTWMHPTRYWTYEWLMLLHVVHIILIANWTESMIYIGMLILVHKPLLFVWMLFTSCNKQVIDYYLHRRSTFIWCHKLSVEEDAMLFDRVVLTMRKFKHRDDLCREVSSTLTLTLLPLDVSRHIHEASSLPLPLCIIVSEYCQGKQTFNTWV